MELDRSTPLFRFAVTEEVKNLCPISLDGKEIKAEDFVPNKTRQKDTGYDVRCAEPNGMILKPGCYFKMKLGFRVYAPEGWWLNLAPRSGTFINSHIHALYGVIEEVYENILQFVGQYIPDACKLLNNGDSLEIKFGQRIAQIIPAPRWEMNYSSISNDQMDSLYKDRNDPRGTGGFGSSGIA